ncbi:hypothetical protein [Sphingomonas spermidinifaciens]|uniref:hypothetical protein n=1 Tax=Sphingomonas spermidinifaciens TaxID=1141889 RepID=UPI001596A1A1|nr:hypothetical protein [Sphingomonas spermidinifaciens]
MAGILAFFAIFTLSLMVAVAADRRWNRMLLSVVTGAGFGAAAWFVTTMLFYYILPS